MKKIVGVRFRTIMQIRYFEVCGFDFSIGAYVVCKTVNGMEYGRVCNLQDVLGDEFDTSDFEGEVLRVATLEDCEKNKKNLEFEKEVMEVGKNFIKKQKLNMTLVSVVSSFDRSKLLFFFSSSVRVDFRALVRNLASVFHIKIELRQIGIRDEAKLISGIGSCGRVFCCSSFLNEFHHVSVKMAKEQNLSLNPKKISGCCGRLMCCLKYEQPAYNFLNKVCPKIGSKVMSPDGVGIVVNGNPLTGKYRVKLNDSGELYQRVFNKESLKIIKKE